MLDYLMVCAERLDWADAACEWADDGSFRVDGGWPGVDWSADAG